MAFIYDLSDTWNAGATVFTAIKMNVTDTASATGSKLIDLQVNGTTRFDVDKNGQVEISAGTELLPSLAALGDTNTGMWFPAADTVAWSTGGSERMRINSAGNVGIGTTAPDALLSVNGVASFGDGTAAAPSITNLGDLNTGIFFPAADSISLSTNGSERFAITSTGEIRIPVQTQLTNAGNNLIYTTVGTSTIELRCNNAQQATASSILLNGRGPNDNILFNTNATERMRITSAGNVGIGTSTFGTSAVRSLAIGTGTAPTTGPADTIQIYSTDLSAGNTMLSLFTEGTVVNANTTAATTHRIAIRVNGTVYYLLANTAA